MTPNDIDLLPYGARQRVLKAKGMGRATRTALGLVLIGAVAAGGAEAARMDAAERVEVARLSAASTWAANEARARLERAIDVQSLCLRRELADTQRVPLMSLLAAAVEPLPKHASLRRVLFRENDGALEIEFEVAGANASIVADALRTVAESFEVSTLSSTIVRVVVSRDRHYEMTFVSREDSVDR